MRIYVCIDGGCRLPKHNNIMLDVHSKSRVATSSTVYYSLLSAMLWQELPPAVDELLALRSQARKPLPSRGADHHQSSSPARQQRYACPTGWTTRSRTTRTRASRRK